MLQRMTLKTKNKQDRKAQTIALVSDTERKCIERLTLIGRALSHRDFTNLICSTLYVNDDS